MTLNLPEKAQSGKGSGPACVIGELCGVLPQASGKLPDAHSVGSFCDNNLGVFIVAKIAMENTDAVPPAHPGSPERQRRLVRGCNGATRRECR
jgi:hypothetical protein